MLGVRLPVALLGLEQPIDHEIAHGQADAFEDLPRRQGLPWLRQRVSRVPLDGFPERRRRHQEIVRTVAQSLIARPHLPNALAVFRHGRYRRDRSPATGRTDPDPSIRMGAACSSGTYPTPMPLITPVER